MTSQSNYDQDPYYGEDIYGTMCPECRGTCVERFTDDPCPGCYGEGYLPEQMFLQVRIRDQAAGDVT